MERAVAIKKLTKLLGKNLGYRVDPKAPDKDERAEAKAAMPAHNLLCEVLAKQREARLRQLLNNDAEFQQIKAEHERAKEQRAKVGSVLYDYRFTAGVSTGMFFVIKAQGDSWEEVIAKLQKERVS